MSVKVNLLPGDVAKKERAGQLRGLIAVVFAAVVALLGVVYWLQLGQLTEAQADLAVEQQALAALQGELAELSEFGDLQQRRDDAVALLGTAMGNEASIAGILQDIAAVMPPDAELTTLSMTARTIEEQQLGDERAAVGTMALSGRSLAGHAPGLERFLIEFDKIAGFSDVFFTNSTRNDVEVSGVPIAVVEFDVEIDLGPETLTLRYVDGLPEGLR